MNVNGQHGADIPDELAELGVHLENLTDLLVVTLRAMAEKSVEWIVSKEYNMYNEAHHTVKQRSNMTHVDRGQSAGVILLARGESESTTFVKIIGMEVERLLFLTVRSEELCDDSVLIESRHSEKR
jgi:hypothetical protein